MGSFFTNIHLRTTERERVEQEWQHYWDERGQSSWAWVSPEYDGWVSVFDWRSDQQDDDTLIELPQFLSAKIDCVSLAFKVYDSEVAEYWLHRAGKQADYYTSNSEYFAAFEQAPEAGGDEGIYSGYGPNTKTGYPMNEDLSDGGDTSVLRKLVGSMADEVELDAILRTPSYIADDIVTALASAIGINDSWASLGYHYLVTEGEDTVTGFEHFHHLPVGAPLNPVGLHEL